jgi:outer membrane biosynthesis protein TonB
MGRPPTKPKRFKDGFYIEVRHKGSETGMKIRFDDEAAMLQAAKEYSPHKNVVILGEHKKDRWLAQEPAPTAKKLKTPKADKPAKPAKKEKPVAKAKVKKPAKPAKKAKVVAKAKKVKPAAKAVKAKSKKKR